MSAYLLSKDVRVVGVGVCPNRSTHTRCHRLAADVKGDSDMLLLEICLRDSGILNDT